MTNQNNNNNQQGQQRNQQGQQQEGQPQDRGTDQVRRDRQGHDEEE